MTVTVVITLVQHHLNSLLNVNLGKSPFQTPPVQRLTALLMTDKYDAFKDSDMKPRINPLSGQLFVSELADPALKGKPFPRRSTDQAGDRVWLLNLLGAQCGEPHGPG